jgi:hypothetical protein
MKRYEVGDLLERIRRTVEADDEPIQVILLNRRVGYFRLACCDCSLVHEVVVLRHKDNRNVTTFWKRDERSTGQLRRWERKRKRR